MNVAFFGDKTTFLLSCGSRFYNPLPVKQVAAYQCGKAMSILRTTESHLLKEHNMEMNQSSNRIHPLVAGAAASVMLVSLVGVAAITGLFPSSHSTVAESVPMASQQAAVANISTQAQQTAPVVVREVVEHKTVIHDEYVPHATAPRHTHTAQYTQDDSTPRYAPAPVYQRPAPTASNSPVGIGVGAVVGGLLGSQVGGGNGKTLATIAGAVGGGYVGNEVAKRNF